MKPPKHDFLARASAAWGADLPAWVQALAEEANRTSGAAAAARIGYSPPVVSQVLSRTYPGDLARIQEKVAGALMGVTVECPVLGDIARDRCLDEQAKGFAATSSVRARLYRACRAGCPHSRLKGEAG
ncbi:transcriptional regulator [Rhodoplanes elegans]|uniref:Transcriptional regulator n=1 Tax=Rhodoplanes elegans TaxID=29408 RepID=A0A327K7N7_9BRAD|nr:transcriptional regulator [Rhodoplanes elegans]MBK5960809.1 transcriptional regulator [Rhodoplanes elegans]RAI33685.1 transcriptional regulator [Rhodoplanes elegans]